MHATDRAKGCLVPAISLQANAPQLLGTLHAWSGSRKVHPCSSAPVKALDWTVGF